MRSSDRSPASPGDTPSATRRHTSRSAKLPSRLGAILGAAAGTLFLACVPIFTGGLFQTLTLNFRFDQLVAEGEELLVHVAVFPEAVKLKKNFVRVSGRMTGDDLPDGATLEAEISNPETGKVVQRVSVKLDVGDDGHFSASSKIKKNINSGEMLSVTLEPRGGDLTAQTEITVCIDLVKRKKDLGALPSCVAGDDGDDDDSDGDGGGDDALATFSSLQNDDLPPTCARGGCHAQASSAGGLSLAAASAYNNLVDAPSQQQPGLNRVTPNDPERSYLIKKLRGDLDISGSRMPQGGPFLSDAEIDRFVRWIDNGAPND